MVRLTKQGLAKALPNFRNFSNKGNWRFEGQYNFADTVKKIDGVVLYFHEKRGPDCILEIEPVYYAVPEPALRVDITAFIRRCTCDSFCDRLKVAALIIDAIKRVLEDRPDTRHIDFGANLEIDECW